MELSCDKAIAIRTFLDFIGYRKWHRDIKEVVVVTRDERKTQLGIANFAMLAEAINYLDPISGTLVRRQTADGAKPDECPTQK